MNDSVWKGCAIGLLTPAIPGLWVWLLMQRLPALKDADLLLIGCVALNALWMNYFFRKNQERTGRGILSITFLWAFAFFAYKTF